ncbi:MAG TPA: hypothetical protein VNH18_32635 [Bryobacteraceae bacterium]|nr:hypothetical protein [Bryobacteraceae bacterium]
MAETSYRPADPSSTTHGSFQAGAANPDTPVLVGGTGTVYLQAQGDSTNISIALVPKGSGTVTLTPSGDTGSVAALALTETLTGSAYGASSHEDVIYSKITLTPATTVTAANGLNTIRGEFNLTTGKTLGSGSASFVTGVYGRGNIFGTVNIGSGDLAAVYGKFDLNGSTLTSGHIAPVQSNIVNPPASASTTGAVALFYGESASGTKINAGMELYMASNFAFVMTDVNTSNFLPAISSTTLNGINIKVQLNGTTYYIKTGTAA